MPKPKMSSNLEQLSKRRLDSSDEVRLPIRQGNREKNLSDYQAHTAFANESSPFDSTAAPASSSASHQEYNPFEIATFSEQSPDGKQDSTISIEKLASVEVALPTVTV